jgi:hypothetical protein
MKRDKEMMDCLESMMACSERTTVSLERISREGTPVGTSEAIGKGLE